MSGAYNDKEYRNLLSETGYTPDEINARINEWFDSMFTVGTPQCIYGCDDAGAYLIDTGNDDVRTEGQSYGMMMAVQMNRRDIFDAIWGWTYKYMLHKEGKYEGYFAWSCALSGKRNAEGPAPDGEEYFAMALFFASHRWGDGEAPYNYGEQARTILRHCLHQNELTAGTGDPMWDPDNYQIKFVPETKWTDPSYHLPHFYELFALWADCEDREFWHRAAEASRKLIIKAAHPETGLSPEYAEFDGSPKKSGWGGGASFYSDAYRVALNIALDTLWFGYREEYNKIAVNMQNFFAGIGYDNKLFADYNIDGMPKERPALHPVGLGATIAAASAARCDISETAIKWIRLFMETPLRIDKRRYFDSDLCFFALLILSGEYKIY